MATVSGVGDIKGAISKTLKVAERGKGHSGTVGYTQAYAVFVHENLEAQHKVGQAKFLEQPARDLQPVFPIIIKDTIRKGGTFSQGILMACLRLQRDSQLLVPVDTGALKNSAYTAMGDERQEIEISGTNV